MTPTKPFIFQIDYAWAIFRFTEILDLTKMITVVSHPGHARDFA